MLKKSDEVRCEEQIRTCILADVGIYRSFKSALPDGQHTMQVYGIIGEMGFPRDLEIDLLIAAYVRDSINWGCNATHIDGSTRKGYRERGLRGRHKNN